MDNIGRHNFPSPQFHTEICITVSVINELLLEGDPINAFLKVLPHSKQSKSDVPVTCTRYQNYPQCPTI
uniref:Uncharacterized protein n=1 Tax=Romanomermis culicivorax TaxID=13658 RepID=A0A915LB39_ROMCU